MKGPAELHAMWKQAAIFGAKELGTPWYAASSAPKTKLDELIGVVGTIRGKENELPAYFTMCRMLSCP
jgi:hypothetical protein